MGSILEEFEKSKRVESKRAVVILSGGIDSSTVCALACSEGYSVYAITFDYHQRHRIELESAKKIAKLLSGKEGIGARLNFPGFVKVHKIFTINLNVFGSSALTDKTISVPMNRDESVVKTTDEEIPVTYVPVRNLIFLSLASAWAETLDIQDIFIGVTQVDYSGYPDCREDFINAFERAVNLASKKSVEGKLKFKIHTPFINMKKSDIIKKGVELGLDYGLTWSCYNPILYRLACGKCDSCRFRLQAFKEANIPDTVRYFSEGAKNREGGK